MKTLKKYFFVLIAIILASCTDQPHIKKGVVYPDLISPIYYIDTFQIVSPRVAVIDSVPYIFPKMMSFEDKDDFLKQKCVVRYLTPDMHFHRSIYYVRIHNYRNLTKTFYHLTYQNEFYFDEMFIMDDSIKNIPVYKFVFKPETFLLTIISTIDSVVTQEGRDDAVLEILFSKDYILALTPIYSKKDLKKINELLQGHMTK